MLTPKQETFCQEYINTGNASEAYRLAYRTESMKPATVNRKAKELQDNGKITARLSDIRGALATRHRITLDSLLDELETARQAALSTGAPSAMVAATMAKAKLLGLDKPSSGEAETAPYSCVWTVEVVPGVAPNYDD